MTWTTQPPVLRPLAFDRANRGRPIKSRFPLFQLPIELLHEVAPHIPSPDLETLALVDRDCRQLARSMQFFNVRLTYSDVSLEILETLLTEMQVPHESAQALGSCIRHLTLDLGSPALIETRLSRYPNLFDIYKCLPASKSGQDAYLHALATILYGSLPNLHSLNWKSRVKITTELMHSVVSSSARHVMINHALFDPHLEVFDFYGSSRWLLESLILDVDCLVDSAEDMDTLSSTMTDILRAVSPTLQTLSWKGTRLPFHLSFGRDIVVFPRLRNLHLDAVPMSDFTILSSLLSVNTRITSLAVSSSDRATAEFLTQRGFIPSLESFSWIGHRNSTEEQIMTFLEANFHLHSLSIGQPLLPITIQTRILPLITFNFHHLTSLHLVWDCTTISKETISAIGSLHWLRKLWLSAGNQFGWCNDWKIEHDVMLETLQPLHHLESLTFSRDTYETNGHPLLDSSIEKYYINSVFPFGLNFEIYLMPDEKSLLDKVFGLGQYADMSFDQARFLQSRLRKAAWERWHRERMASVAKAYASTFTQLKWCYVGQYRMRIDRDEAEAIAIIETAFRQENIKPY